MWFQQITMSDVLQHWPVPVKRMRRHIALVPTSTRGRNSRRSSLQPAAQSLTRNTYLIRPFLSISQPPHDYTITDLWSGQIFVSVCRLEAWPEALNRFQSALTNTPPADLFFAISVHERFLSRRRRRGKSRNHRFSKWTVKAYIGSAGASFSPSYSTLLARCPQSR
jgi:hypothetical protein